EGQHLSRRRAARVHQDAVEAAQFLIDRRGDPVDRAGVLHIEGEAVGVRTQFLGRCRDGGGVSRQQQDVGTLRDERRRGRPPQAPAPAANHKALAAQSEIHVCVPFLMLPAHVQAAHRSSRDAAMQSSVCSPAPYCLPCEATSTYSADGSGTSTAFITEPLAMSASAWLASARG